MGLDPLTWIAAASAASGIYGAVSGNKTAKNNLNAQQARQGKIEDYAKPFLQQGANPFAQLLLQSVGGGGTGTGTQGFNTGQDGFMQFLNRGGAQFDNSPQFAALKLQDSTNLAEQIAQLHGSAGSLGERFGTGMNRNEALLRSTSLANTGARNAGIASASFESGANRGLQAQSLLASILGQAGGLQQNQQNSNVNILSLLAGMPIGQQQPNQVPGALGDISQLLMFLPFLKQALGGAGQKAPVAGLPPMAPTAGGGFYGGFPVY